MGTVTPVGFNLRWTRPVYVGQSDELDTTIYGPADAIRWMQIHFSHKHGFSYWRAHALCHSALLGTIHQDFARQSFVDAWVEQADPEETHDS
ncbi:MULTISPECIES: DUF982 domain-containing protein [Rhizobium]|uniref:DUF982 domain-containing protein n=1 Tax=Rhizobium TaxID=379 RepID=UPI00166CAE81|nr:DUF982 domain-containing protein [Rhizobium wenxiniae]GGG23742.1 hypothetical protein GCM10010924_61610 [Rhizobium wenxiniae]